MFQILADTMKSGGKMIKSVATVPTMAHEALVAYSEVGLESAVAKAEDKRKYLPLAQAERESKLADKKAELKTKLMEAKLKRVQEAQEVELLKVQVEHAQAQNKLISEASAEFDPKKPLRKAGILSKVLSPEMGAEADIDPLDALDNAAPESILNDWIK